VFTRIRGPVYRALFRPSFNMARNGSGSIPWDILNRPSELRELISMRSAGGLVRRIDSSHPALVSRVAARSRDLPRRPCKVQLVKGAGNPYAALTVGSGTS
jgi:hypothetical protein